MTTPAEPDAPTTGFTWLHVVGLALLALLLPAFASFVLIFFIRTGDPMILLGGLLPLAGLAAWLLHRSLSRRARE